MRERERERSTTDTPSGTRTWILPCTSKLCRDLYASDWYRRFESDFVAGTRRFIDLSVQHASALEGVRATLLGHCLSTHVLLGCVCTYARPDISAPRQLNANISCLLPHCGSPARPYRWPATVLESIHRPIQRASVRRLWPGATHTCCPPWRQVPVASFAGWQCPAFHGFLRRAIFRPGCASCRLGRRFTRKKMARCVGWGTPQGQPGLDGVDGHHPYDADVVSL